MAHTRRHDLSVESVSVVVCAYRTPRDVLARALRSVALQRLPVNEAVVVDDGSEPSVEVPASGWPFCVTAVRHGTNRGKAAALNTGVARATGDVLAFLDADDEWLPWKLERQLAVLHDDRSEPCAVAGLAMLRASAARAVRVPSGEPRPVRIGFGRMLRGSPSGWSAMVVPRRTYEAVGGCDERLRRSQDWEFLLRATATSGRPLALLPEPVVIYDYSARSIESAEYSLRVFRQWHDLAAAGEAGSCSPRELGHLMQRRLIAHAALLLAAGREDPARRALSEARVHPTGSVANKLIAGGGLLAPWALRLAVAYAKMLRGRVPFDWRGRDAMYAPRGGGGR